MKKYVYGVFEYLMDNERARQVLFWFSWIGLLLCAWILPIWLYSGVILFGVLLHMHGMIDGAVSMEKRK